jgi:hypothetical protein
MNLISKTIKTRKDISNYIDFLESEDMLYHFDEDACDILSRVSDHSIQLFTDEESILIDKRRDEMLKLDYEFTFDYALTKLD